MKQFNKTQTVAIIAASISIFGQFFYIKPAMTMPNGSEIVKYLNPIHEKSYLNEKQDRLIKKKSFKTTEIEGLQPIANKDVGLFATIDFDKCQDTTYISHLLSKPELSGISCTLPWRILEPEETNFNWKIIDELLQFCAKHNKQLILRISTCGMDVPEQKAAESTSAKGKEIVSSSDTPDWVFDAGTQSLTYTGKDGKPHLMPIFWDGTYLAKWTNFINELGRRYDKNPNFQSIGITGGGVMGSTKVVPEFAGNKDAYNELETKLKTSFGMNPRQLVNHWKYAADVFPKAFQKQHLNFDLDPPLPNRKGQDCLDEISDYLVYRYGERVYITRQNVKNDKRGFDDYRLLLKFKNDTLSGYQFTPAIGSDAIKPLLAKVTKNAFDDGLSFAEIPAELFNSNDQAIKDWLTQMRLHLGYQLVLQEISIPATVGTGKTLPIHFAFFNTGAASAKRLSREMDKGVPSSYKIQLEFRDAQGKTKALMRRTPATSTCDWLGEQINSSDEELKAPLLKPGKYEVYLAIVDDQSNEKLNYCRAIPNKPQLIGKDLLVGSIEFTSAQ